MTREALREPFAPLVGLCVDAVRDGHKLVLIEVQCGAYMWEDDVVRFEDVYGRAGS